VGFALPAGSPTLLKFNMKYKKEIIQAIIVAACTAIALLIANYFFD
jgi:hypothetical protein